MFREQPGLVGVAYCREGEEWLTLTVWRDDEAVERLGSSKSYQDAVAELVGSGMLVGDQRTEAFVVEDSEGIF